MTLESLMTLGGKGLTQALQSGHPIDPGDIADTEYIGVSLGMPGWVDRLAWKTFLKTFHADPDIGGLRGWNIRLEQDGIEAVPRPMLKNGAPIAFGHYRVRDLEDGEAPRGIQVGLMLDYGEGGNGWWDPANLLRDPLVALHPGQTDLLLGWTYVRFAGLTLSTPSFFALRRVGPLAHCIGVPSGR